MSEIYYSIIVQSLAGITSFAGTLVVWYLYGQHLGRQQAMAKTRNPDAHLRMMTLADLSRVVEIENECFNTPWTLKEFKALCKDSDHLCGVAVINERVVGYIIYEMKKSATYLKCLAVAHAHRRKGIASKLVHQMERMTTECNRYSIRMHVAENNLLAQKFFRALEFKATSVCWNFYDGLDAYYFIKRFPKPAGAVSVTKANG